VNNFHLYSTPTGLLPVSSPIKRLILGLLSERKKTQKEVMLLIKRSQSTTARHMLELEAAGLIRSNIDENDSRRKIYRISGELVAKGGEPVNELKGHLERSTANGIKKEGNLKENINKSLRYVVESWGLSLDSMLRETGRSIGPQVTAKLGVTNGNLQNIVKELGTFWKNNDMGVIKIQKKKPLVLRIESNYDCTGVPDVGRPLCALDEGIMEAVFKERTGNDWKVREFVCHGTGHDHCLFTFEKISA
jgi:predicted hydrocarbon binding protein